jgi:hypothetical protein
MPSRRRGKRKPDSPISRGGTARPRLAPQSSSMTPSYTPNPDDDPRYVLAQAPLAFADGNPGRWWTAMAPRSALPVPVRHTGCSVLAIGSSPDWASRPALHALPACRE